jgi:hypothetical protein
VVHHKLCVASQIWQIVFALQTRQVFRLALRKKAQYVVVDQMLFVVKGLLFMGIVEFVWL